MNQLKAFLMLIVIGLFSQAFIQSAETDNKPLKAGNKVPPFEAVGQDGRMHTFASLCGKKGLIVVFVRSVGW